jgi:hypothetical protein
VASDQYNFGIMNNSLLEIFKWMRCDVQKL